MSYISAEKNRDKIFVWERTKKGREFYEADAPYYFYVKDPKGKYKSMYGDRLSIRRFNNSRDFNFEKAKLKASGKELFESDIPAEIKYLSKHYYNKEAPDLHVTMHDIEVDYNPEIGHASPSNPYAPINSVALIHIWKKTCVVLAIPPNFAARSPTEDEYKVGPAPQSFIKQMTEIAELPKGMKLEVTFCRTEEELLIQYLKEIHDSDVLCGWNSDMFDHPYIAKRVERLGPANFRKLSFKEARSPAYRWVMRFNKEEEVVDFGGRIGADYMELFKKYEMAERPSYKLENIAEEMLPKLPKLEYEGSLATLYRRNFAWFVRYNIRDTEILEGLEARLGYMDLANKMMHLSTGIWKNVVGTLKLAEYAVVNYCHNELNGLVVNDFHRAEEKHRIQGAFVLLPQIGEHENTGSIDLNSLYPSSIRAINISPETLIGQFEENVKAVEEIAKGTDTLLTCTFDYATQVPEKLRGRSVRRPASQFKEDFLKLKWAVSGYGTIFNQTKEGVIPMILADWYATRKKYQALKAKETDKIKKSYYDKLQYTYKIKLNAFYGALTNEFFRFYDLRMGESTTGTGRMILLHQCAKTCELLEGTYTMPDIYQTEVDKKTGKIKEHYGYSKDWPVVYGDTDSTYFKTLADSPEHAIQVADSVGKLVNKSFPEYMRKTFLCTEGYYDKIKCGRENVSDRGIYVDKKMYILHIIDSEGEAVDYMKVMGLRTKKTTLPKEIAKKLNNYIEMYLKGKPWEEVERLIVDYKDELMAVEDIMRIGLPTGIKTVDAHEDAYKLDPAVHLSGHAAAAVHYNKCLKDYNDHESMKIINGSKIKVFNLVQMHGRFKSIAIPVDIEQVPEWFLRDFEVDRKLHIKKLVDKALENILKAIGKIPPSKQKLLADDMLGFE